MVVFTSQSPEHDIKIVYSTSLLIEGSHKEIPNHFLLLNLMALISGEYDSICLILRNLRSVKGGEEMANYKDIIATFKDKPGGIIEAYHALQNEFNYIPKEAIAEAAKVFGVSDAQAYGVATFYSYLSTETRGKYIIRVCESAPCHIAGADEVVKAIEKELGIKVGRQRLTASLLLSWLSV